MYRAMNPRQRRYRQSFCFICGMAISALAGANPQGAQIVHGSVAFMQPNSRTLEITNSPSAIINWQSFDIGGDETTRFIQQSADSAVLNRVVSGNSSEIFGRLLSNGRVFLLNQSGILVGRDATIDTAGLVLSTLGMTDQDFLAGRLHFEGDAATGEIKNQGYIKSAPGGEIILLAPRIVNEAVPGNPRSGLIESPAGDLILAAGHTITIASLDHPDISFDVRAPEHAVVNLGRLLAQGGSVSVLAGTLQHSGEINADGLTLDSAGNVVLTVADTAYLDRNSVISASAEGHAGKVAVTAGNAASEGRIYALGHIEANGDSGGDIELTADRVLSAGSVSVRGLGAGGEVRITTEHELIATASSRIDASADLGVGGKVAIDGGKGVFTSGLITATGLTGGNVEVLADEVKLVAATIDASGEAGGGAVRIGGGFQGGEGLHKAQSTEVNGASVIKADAQRVGNGGSVVVWADDTTRFAGVISAHGGSINGNGGSVEVSGKVGLAFNGQVDVDAAHGVKGSLLLDPKNIIFTADAQGAGTFQLIDPHPGLNNSFGSSIQTFFESPDFSTPAKILVFDTLDDFGGADAGAAYLYRMSDGALLSALTGSQAGDRIGSGGLGFAAGVRILRSPLWNSSAGALTEFDVVNGTSGAVSSATSLVGANAGDAIGNFGVQTLGSAIAVRSPTFNGQRGAVTILAPGALKGVVGAGNSLIGANALDQVGAGFFQNLGNGNFVLTSGHGGAGAVTFIDPNNAPRGTVGVGNSLVGSAPGDDVGSGGVISLGGQYAVLSPDWNGTFGAITIGNSATGLSGTVSAVNSLVGSASGDRVGDNGLTGLGSGHWAAVSALAGAGAVTVIDQFAPTVGLVSAANSLIGNAGDEVGSGGLQFLGSSTWAVLSPSWDASIIETDAGAVSFLDGALGTFAGTASSFVGLVSNANSLVGATSGDGVGVDGIDFVAGSIYAVRSSGFDHVIGGTVDTGALTWYAVGSALAGDVSTANSLIGAFDNDGIGGGSDSIISLFSGHALLHAPDYASKAGAVVFINPASLVVGQIGAGNALIGSTANDNIGGGGIFDFGSDVVILSPDWDNGPANVGAITVASATAGVVGVVGAGNSLIGAAGGDQIGSGGLTFLDSGNALVASPEYLGAAGAVTFLDINNGHLIGDVDFVAVVDSTNSLVGPSAGDQIGSGGIELVGDSYLVLSPLLGSSSEHGAVTIADIFSGVAGTVSVANSLLGASAGDHLGSGGIFELFNGSVLLLSPDFASNAGAVTYLDIAGGQLIGDSDFFAIADNTNSLLGANPGDDIGGDGIEQFFAGFNSYYALFSGDFAGGQGAVTFADAASGRAGTVSNANSFTGTTIGDNIGTGANYQSLSGGNVVLLNEQWNSNRGAATFVDLVNGAGLAGDISSANSVVGGAVGDRVGSGGVTQISGTSLFAVRSPDWANGATVQAGALTWGDVDTGANGVVGLGNSLVGSTTGDAPGSGGRSIVFGTGGTRVAIFSPDWDNGVATQAGAITTFLASSPTTGAIGAANSLVGGNSADDIGGGFQIFLSNGNRLFVNPDWDSNTGAVTFFDGSSDLLGVVSGANSLVGASAGDDVGGWDVTEAFGSGHYYVAVPSWNGDMGALTFASIATGISGTVSAANSLVGSTAGDRIGESVTDLIFSDKYLVVSDTWNASRGAVTVLDPSSARVGAVSAANSLVGATAGDRVGDFVQQLFRDVNQGLVILRTNAWNSNAGAVTLLDPRAPITGTVGANNSLVGRAGDALGSSGVSELQNGALLVRSPQWSDGTAMNFGALTYIPVSGRANALRGLVSSRNSLVGSHLNDAVGSSGFTTLSSGNILVRSPNWFDNRGAVTFINIDEGRTGLVSGVNSLVGELANDFIGSGGITTLGANRALVRSPVASVKGIAGAGRLDIIDGSSVLEVGGDIGFGLNPGGELLVSIASVERFLNTGANLILQANNDIFLPAGVGLVAESGGLFLSAGRSIDLRSDLIVRDGTLALLANAGGANRAFRDDGDGNISLVASEHGLRVMATTLSLEAQNIFVTGGDSPNAFAALIGLGTTSIHAHGSGLLKLQAGTVAGSSLVPNVAQEIISSFITAPESASAPAALVVGLFGLSVIADDLQISGGGSEGAFAALASFGDFSVQSINIDLVAGTADNADALLLGLGGVADISFTNCNGCNEILFDPLFDSSAQSGIFISGLFREPTVDAILAMLDRDQDGEDDDEEKSEAAECN